MNRRSIIFWLTAMVSVMACEVPFINDGTPTGPEAESRKILASAEPTALFWSSAPDKWLRGMPFHVDDDDSDPWNAWLFSNIFDVTDLSRNLIGPLTNMIPVVGEPLRQAIENLVRKADRSDLLMQDGTNPDPCPTVSDSSVPSEGRIHLVLAGGCTLSRDDGTAYLHGRATLEGSLSDSGFNVAFEIVEPLVFKSFDFPFNLEGRSNISAAVDPSRGTARAEGLWDIWAHFNGSDEKLPLMVGDISVHLSASEVIFDGAATETVLELNPDASSRPRPQWNVSQKSLSYDRLTMRQDTDGTMVLGGHVTFAQSFWTGTLPRLREEENFTGEPTGRVDLFLGEVTLSHTCPHEPLSGSIEMRGYETVRIVYDGETECDGRVTSIFEKGTAILCVSPHCEALAVLDSIAAASAHAGAMPPSTFSDVYQWISTSDPKHLVSDANGNGESDIDEVLQYLETRIVYAPGERPQKGYDHTITEILLDRIAATVPVAADRAYFLKFAFKLAQSLKPLDDLSKLFSATTGDEIDFTALLGPLTGILSPELPCSDGGLAECGHDMALAVEKIGANINAPSGYRLAPTRITIGSNVYELGGIYNEAAFRILAAFGEGIRSAYYFAAAHIDLNAILSEATTLLSGNLSFDMDTAGEVLTALDQLDGIYLNLLEGAVTNPNGPSNLTTSQDSAEAALLWAHGNATSRPAVVSALERSTGEDTVIRFIDSNIDGRLNGCDEITGRFLPSSFSSFTSLSPSTLTAEGCGGPTTQASVQLPKMQGGQPLDYNALWSAQSALWTKLGKAVRDPSIAVTSRELAAGSPALSTLVGDAFEVYPGVLFKSGLSALTPASTGSGTLLKLKIEAEVNTDAPACPNGKTATGSYVCKDRMGKTDWSSSITHGDGDHFSGALAKDGLFVDEALLDSVGAPADHLYRKDQGGGYLFYMQFKDPTLKGLLKVSDRLIGELTESGKAVCSRTIGAAPSSGYVSTDDRALNAFSHWFMLQMAVCGKKGVFGEFLDFSDSSGFLALAP